MLPVKDNQPHLLDAIEKLFQDVPDTLSEETTHPVLGKPIHIYETCLLYTSPSPRDRTRSRMPSSA